ncbi:MAG: porin family protein [Candidatus Limimorpha sp.]
MFLLFPFSNKVNAQDSRFHYGVCGGIGMSTINGIEESGLKLGLTGGVCGKYIINEHSRISADLAFSSYGQQSQIWIESEMSNKMKVYKKHTFNYITIPILYQYYFTDILGLETGSSLNFCTNALIFSKIGNSNWETTRLTKNDYNFFDYCLVFGVYTTDLVPQSDLFVKLRVYIGMNNVLKNTTPNKNFSIQISTGYLLK